MTFTFIVVVGLSAQNDHCREFQEIRLMVLVNFKVICDVNSHHLRCALFKTYSHFGCENTQGHQKQQHVLLRSFFRTFNLKLPKHFREAEIFLGSYQNLS